MSASGMSPHPQAAPQPPAQAEPKLALYGGSTGVGRRITVGSIPVQRLL